MASSSVRRKLFPHVTECMDMFMVVTSGDGNQVSLIGVFFDQWITKLSRMFISEYEQSVMGHFAEQLAQCFVQMIGTYDVLIGHFS